MIAELYRLNSRDKALLESASVLLRKAALAAPLRVAMREILAILVSLTESYRLTETPIWINASAIRCSSAACLSGTHGE